MATDFNPLSLVAAPVTGVFNLLGANKQAKAATHAADLQAAAAQAALDYTKDQKAKQEAAYAPYAALGAQGASMLPSVTRQAPTQGPPAPYAGIPQGGYMPGGSASMPASPTAGMPPQAAPFSSMGTAPPMAGPQVQPGAMVLLQAPDGSQKSVPATVAPQLIARGAKRIS